MGAGQVIGEVTTEDIDLVAANDRVSFGLNVGMPAGPCGAVSVYGECAGDTLRICTARNTAGEALSETDCAAMNATCRPARGVTPASCVALAPPDAGIVEEAGVTGPDAGAAVDDDAAADATAGLNASAAADAAAPGADARAAVDATVPDPVPSPGCGCATSSPPSTTNVLLAVLVLGLMRRRRREPCRA